MLGVLMILNAAFAIWGFSEQLYILAAMNGGVAIFIAFGIIDKIKLDRLLQSLRRS